MHWTLTIIACFVIWAMLGGIWRAGSLALAGAWIGGQLYWQATGDSLPIELYCLIDPLVIYAIWRWQGSVLDWFIVGLFPLEWLSYAVQQGAIQWWTLWVLTCVQLLLAGPWPQVQRGLHSFSHGPLYRREAG